MGPFFSCSFHGITESANQHQQQQQKTRSSAINGCIIIYRIIESKNDYQFLVENKSK